MVRSATLGLVGVSMMVAGGAFAETVLADGPSDDWPMFGGDPGRTGSRGWSTAGTGKVIWEFFTGPESLDAGMTPAVVNGTVYAGGGGRVFALDAATGSQKWRFDVPLECPSDADQEAHRLTAAAVVEGRVYFGADDGCLYALDASTGQMLWRFAAGLAIRSAPAVADGLVFVGSDDRHIYALDAQTGEQRWALLTGGEVTAPPAIWQDTVYVGSRDGTLYALSAASGQPSWKRENEGFASNPVVTGAAIREGIAYLSPDDGPLMALAATDGRLLWSKTLEGPGSYHQPVASTVILTVVHRNSLWALDPLTGDAEWNVTPGRTGFRTEPSALSHGTVFTPDSRGSIWAIDGKTGTLHWNERFVTYWPSSPTVVNGVLYVGSQHFWIFALDAGAGEGAPTIVHGPPDEADTPMPASGAWVLTAALVAALRLRRETRT